MDDTINIIRANFIIVRIVILSQEFGRLQMVCTQHWALVSGDGAG